MAFVESAFGGPDSADKGTGETFFFEADSQRRALSYIGYTLNQAHGVFLLTGEAGCGKSTLVARVARDLRKRGSVVVSFPAKRVEGRDIFRQVAEEFGLTHYSVPQPELLDAIERHLIGCISNGSRPLLVIDDAERLTEGDLAAITRLCELKHEGGFLLQVILIGREFTRLEFTGQGASHGVNHLVASYHLAPLLKDEVEDYFQAWMRWHGFSTLPAMPDNLRDRVYLWSMGRMGRLQLLVEALSRRLADGVAWRWDESDFEQLLATAGGERKARSVPIGQATLPEDWTVDQRKDRIDSDPERPRYGPAPVSPEPPLGPGAVEQPAARRARKPADESAPARGAPTAADNALQTPWVALCADEAEAYLLTPLLKAVARSVGRCTLLYTNGGLSMEALHWSEGLKSVVQLRRYSLGADKERDESQRMVAHMRYAAECLQGDRVRGLLALNSSDATLALALTAHKRGIPIVRVEAGKRWSNSGHNPDVNQMVIDRLADLLLVGDSLAEANLLMEGITRKCIREVGTLRVDALARSLAKRGVSLSSAAGRAHRGREADNDRYALIALADTGFCAPERLEPLLRLLRDIGELVPVRLLVAASIKEKLEHSGFFQQRRKWNIDHLAGLDPVQSLGALRYARLVITDSELLQVEAAVVRIPCITVAAHTLWPLTVEKGVNRLCPLDSMQIIEAVSQSLAAEPGAESVPAHWDGKAALRAAKAIQQRWPRSG